MYPLGSLTCQLEGEKARIRKAGTSPQENAGLEERRRCGGHRRNVRRARCKWEALLASLSSADKGSPGRGHEPSGEGASCHGAGWAEGMSLGLGVGASALACLLQGALILHTLFMVFWNFPNEASSPFAQTTLFTTEIESPLSLETDRTA